MGNGCPKLAKLDCRLNSIFSTFQTDLSQENFTDVGLKELAKCVKLRSLVLSETSKCTDEGICKLIESCPGLEELYINPYAKITDVSFKAAGECSLLRTMAINGSKITDEGVSHLKKCRNLQELILTTSFTVKQLFSYVFMF